MRAYHTGVFSERQPQELLDSSAASGLDLIPIDADKLEFYDIQALRRRHVARAKLRRPAFLTGVVTDSSDSGELSRREITAEVATHLIAHRSGFLIIRPTIRLDRLSNAETTQVGLLHELQRAAWVGEEGFWWQVPGTSKPLPGSARNYMNWIYLSLFAAWSGRPAHPDELLQLAVEKLHGCDRLHEMFAAHDLEYPYPVSFGTEFQFVVSPRPGEAADAWERRAGALAWSVMRPASAALDVPPGDAEKDARTVCWFMEEHISLLVRSGGILDDTLDVVDSERVQLIEFLTLRRAALMCVQRTTQRVLTERMTVSRRQVARWQYLVATTTDDYVLDARVARLFELLNRHFTAEPRLRDPRDLERQVRSNLDWFQARMEAAAEWTGGLVGAAVGAAALALSLTEVIRIAIATVTNTKVEEVADKQGWLLAAALAVLVTISFAVTLTFVRRMANTLRPKSQARLSRRTIRLLLARLRSLLRSVRRGPVRRTAAPETRADPPVADDDGEMREMREMSDTDA